MGTLAMTVLVAVSITARASSSWSGYEVGRATLFRHLRTLGDAPSDLTGLPAAARDASLGPDEFIRSCAVGTT